MADIEKVTLGIESATSMLELLGKALEELESQRESSLQNKIQWDDIEEHVHNLERSLKNKFDEVAEKQRMFEEKQSETHALIAEREASVAAKEQSSLDRLQELRDIAVSAIAEARKKYKVASPEPVDIRESKIKKVSTSLNDPNATPASAEKNPDNGSGDLAEAVAVEIKPRPQLKQLCEQMDAKGLLKFISENWKSLATLREELSLALKYAPEPAQLVLDSLEGLYPPDQSNLQGNEDSALQGLRRSCLVLMESAAPLLGITEPGVDHPVSSEIKQQAKAIADEWKPKLAGVDIDASNGYSLEAQAFLQLLATFNIAPGFDEDELCKLVIAVSRRRQAPQLCRSLGLTQKMPDVVEDLINRGRQIDAVHFAHVFQLTESFPPVPLLKAYLEDLKNAKKNGGTSTGNVQDPNAQELGALRAVIRCIKDYKLQEEYPVEPLQKRVAQLEKAKYDKKRMGEAAKLQPKKPRATGEYAPRRPAFAAETRQLPPTAFDERGLYAGAAERYPERYPYNAPPTYEPPSYASYGQPVNAQRPYHYPDERVPPAPYNAASSYGSFTGTGAAPNSYGNYMGTGVPSSSSNYGSYTGSGLQPSNQSYMYPGSGLQPSHQSYM
ncbi:FRIGIDA-like protein 3 isoform X1 [Phoenix dactylifera]|uniref:FRIGIDA-like protein n=1 Tax=Phoenix dactylifera TaxID=42345 RepID=A0A8B9A9Q0_PHODC|nr:FRIGIDA-like protein 3 isoform X1 [Phoenix dactylifera]